MPGQLPEALVGLCQAYVQGLESALGTKLHAVYVYGASVFPETVATGDVDVHVILGSPIDHEEKAAIQVLHEQMALHHPPLGAELDAYFLLLEQARRPTLPTHQLQTDMVDESWALHRAHMLAGRCVVLYGPEPNRIFPVPTWSELEAALAGELAYVEDRLLKYPDYCILNLCRLMYSYGTRDVVTSKAAAGCWASEQFPQWRPLIELASQSYADTASAEDVQIMRSEVKGMAVFAREQIAAANARNQAERDSSGGSRP
ncbi:DUF4111 domain-containing protein [Candidatus Bipolaricaulota bacterium]|nr:DUF4111 domain-containing protein [Candidatus Bipolaricaulota bacterium]